MFGLQCSQLVSTSMRNAFVSLSIHVRLVFAALAFVICLAAAQSINAATYTVTRTDDRNNATCAAGDCSLREAVKTANATLADDTINFNIPAELCDSSTNVCTITLGIYIIINENNVGGALIINGSGANHLKISTGTTTFRIFNTHGVATINGVTLTDGGGNGNPGGGNGGAIYVLDGTLILNAVNITGNRSVSIGNGGGVYYDHGTNHQINNSTFSNNAGGFQGGGFDNNGGSLTVTNSTFSGNTASAYGGGFSNSGNLTLRNITVFTNSVTSFGGGIYQSSGTVNIGNSIVAGNFTTSGSPERDFYQGNFSTTSAGYNLIGVNTSVTGVFPAGNPNGNNDRVGTIGAPLSPLLTALGNYGGTTPTLALLTNSPAINNGNNAISGTPATDQRGASRSGNTDIGAFELNNSYVAALPNANLNQPYSQIIVPHTNPLAYTITAGSLPPGLTFNPSAPPLTAIVSGTPTAAGNYSFDITGTSGANTETTHYTLLVNTVPTISDIADQTILYNGTTGALAFTIGDAETPAANLIVSGSSSNQTLVPNANVVLGGSDTNRTVTVTPAASQIGTATITIIVSDGALTAQDTFLLTVNNTAPTVSDIADQDIIKNSNTGALMFTVGDVETPAGSLAVTGGSSNTTLVPNANIVFGGSGASRTVTVTPAANQIGTATITVTVTDAFVSVQETFLLTVEAFPRINGQVTVGGAAGAGATVNLSGSSSATASTDSSGNYSFPNLAYGGSYTVTVSKNGVVFSPANQSVANIQGVSVLNFAGASLCTPRSANLVAWFRAENNPYDSAASGIANANLINGAYAQGKAGQAFSFDGAASSFFANNSVLDITGNITLEAWIKPSSYPSGTVSIVNKYRPMSGAGYNLAIDSSGHIQLYINSLNSSFWSAAVAPLNQWTHVAASFESGKIHVYINGAAEEFITAATSISIATNQFLRIGRNNGAGVFNGLIDEVQIYNRLLTDSEIGANFSAGEAGICSNQLAAMYRAEFNTFDYSGNGFNGVTQDNANFAPGKIGQAFSLDGNGDYINVPNSSSLNLSTAITIEAWIKFDPSGSNAFYAPIVTKGNSSWRLQRYGNSDNLTFDTNGLSNGGLAGNRNVNDGQWHYAAAVFDGSTKYLYIDGTLDVSTPATGTIATNSFDVNIGYEPEASRFWNGLIDEVSIYRRALSAAEVLANYNSQNAGTSGQPFNTTGAQTNVNVELVPNVLNAVFANTTQTGNTVATGYSSTTQLPIAPIGYMFHSPFQAYDIRTSAGYTGNVTVTINVPSVPSIAICASLRIEHFTGGAWVLTGSSVVSYNTGTQVCTLSHVSTSLSPFAVFQNLAPTSANVSVSGRVLVGKDAGLRNAVVVLTDMQGNSRQAVSSSFGYYSFETVEVGQTYIISVISKRYQFAPQVVTVLEEIEEFNFTASP